MSAKWPERFERIAGDLPESGMLTPADEVPYDTVKPARQGYVDRDGVRSGTLSGVPKVRSQRIAEVLQNRQWAR